jgi:hypothetical protein
MPSLTVDSSGVGALATGHDASPEDSSCCQKPGSLMIRVLWEYCSGRSDCSQRRSRFRTEKRTVPRRRDIPTTITLSPTLMPACPLPLRESAEASVTGASISRIVASSSAPPLLHTTAFLFEFLRVPPRLSRKRQRNPPRLLARG